MVAAAALAVDAVARDQVGTARLAGLLAGLAGLVRVDSLREVALLVGVCALLVLRGSRVALPMAVTALGATVLGAVPALWYSWPYLSINAGSLLPLVAATVVLVLLLAVAARVAARRGSQAASSPPSAVAEHVLTPAGAPGSVRRGLPSRGQARVPAGLPGPEEARPRRQRPRRRAPAWRRPLPLALGGLVAATGIVLAGRPWWLVAHQATPDSVARGLSDLQQQQALTVDGLRTYAEQSVRWVTWYTGPVAPVLALGTLTVLGVLAGVWWQRSRRDGSRPPVWLVPAAVGFASTVLVLYRPGITPDHPWADRRLVTSVLPTVALAAVAAIAWTTRTLRARVAAPVFPIAAVLGTVALLWPAWSGSAPVATLATERGESAAVAAVCASLEPQDVVVAVSGGDADGGEDRGTNEWPQAIRGVCDHPALSLITPMRDASVQRGALDRLGTLASASGHRLVVLSATAGDGTPPQHVLDLGLRPRRVARLGTTEDQHALDRPATGTSGLLVEVWTAPWSSRAGG